VEAVLESGIRTGDIVEDGMSAVSTSEMGDAIIKTMAEKAE